MKWQINVSAPVLARNREQQANDPAIIVRDLQAVGLRTPYTMAQEVIISGPSKLCSADGQAIWIETDGPIELIGAVRGLDQ